MMATHFSGKFNLGRGNGNVWEGMAINLTGKCLKGRGLSGGCYLESESILHLIFHTRL